MNVQPKKLMSCYWVLFRPAMLCVRTTMCRWPIFPDNKRTWCSSDQEKVSRALSFWMETPFTRGGEHCRLAEELHFVGIIYHLFVVTFLIIKNTHCCTRIDTDDNSQHYIITKVRVHLWSHNRDVTPITIVSNNTKLSAYCVLSALSRRFILCRKRTKQAVHCVSHTHQTFVALCHIRTKRRCIMYQTYTQQAAHLASHWRTSDQLSV